MARGLIGSIIILIAAAGTVVPDYVASGLTHVLPEGPDHVLFILGLFLLSRSLPVLLIQLTLFTIAHSLTLGLSLYGVVSLPDVWIETAIALSITFVAVENLFARHRLSAWRPWVVLLSGLVHGMGFAHSFAERPIQREDFIPALFSFNFGVEIGQIAVIGIAYAVTKLLSRRDCYTKFIERPACYLLAVSGLWMAALRIA